MKQLVIFLLVALIPLMAVPQDPISRPGKKKQNTTQTTNTSQKRKQQEAEKKRKAEQARKAKEERERKEREEQERKSFEASGSVNGYEYVDLGLSVKWATKNVGASSPSDYGDYYAWGETSTKTSYTEDNSKTYGKSMGNISGNSSYDVARAKWGGNWRLPTTEEFLELFKCTWTWTTQGGNCGYKVTGKNGKSIFLPAAGSRDGTSPNYVGLDGLYWSSTPLESDTGSACRLYFCFSLFQDTSFSLGQVMDWGSRGCGYSVRPVVE